MANWSQYREKAEKANLLIVGAGGIGCELIKNLVLAGFVNLEVVKTRAVFVPGFCIVRWHLLTLFFPD